MEKKLIIAQYLALKASLLHQDEDLTQHNYVCGFQDTGDHVSTIRICNRIIDSYHDHLMELERIVEEIVKVLE